MSPEFTPARTDRSILWDPHPKRPNPSSSSKRSSRGSDVAAPAHAILASNTSSLPVTKIAESTGRPAKVLGMHFFNPVHIMKLLEIVRADTTSQETVDAIVVFGEKMGKDPIAEHLHEELGTEAFRPPKILRRMVGEGKLGKKSGQGFYGW